MKDIAGVARRRALKHILSRMMLMAAMVIPLRPATADSTHLASPEMLAKAKAEHQIGRPVKLEIDWINNDGDWAFLLAGMIRADGTRFDFVGTCLEKAAAIGGASDAVCALLRRNSNI